MSAFETGTAAPLASTGASLAVPTAASVLLVDDQPARLLTYEAVLAGTGVNCVKANSGFEALEKLLAQEFAVLLLDVHMPGMDGFELARRIREHPRLERTPIIFVTGAHVTELDQLKGYEVGAIDYIAVPVVPEILRSKVALLVELHNRRSELQATNRALQETRARLEMEHARVLAERDAQLHAVFEHPQQMTVVLQAERDASGAIRDWIYRDANSRALQMLGLVREQVPGARMSQVLGARAMRTSAVCAQVLETGESASFEDEYQARHLVFTVFRAGTELVVSSALDVTDRKQATLALRELEQRDRALLENAPVGVAHNALSGRFVFVNEAFCRLVGYTAEELRQRTWQEITHPDDLELDRTLAARVLAGELSHYTIEKRYVRKDGSYVWAQLFGNFVRDDRGEAVLGVKLVIDITGRKQADQALLDSQERLLLAKQAALLGTHDWNITTGCIEWDERTRELWGVPPDERVTYETFRAGLHPEDVARTEEAVQRALDPLGDGRYFAQFRVIGRRDRETRWIEATGHAFFDDARPVRLVGMVQDITEKMTAQTRLRASEERLRDLDRRKDEFLAMLAHELRNPVAPISNAAEVLARLLGKDERARSLVAMIQRQSTHLARLLDDLLDVARITQGRIELRAERLALSTCIEQALETVQPQIQAKGHRLRVTHVDGPQHIHADRVRIEQCISNLLTNAAKYTDPGGTIEITSFVRDGRACVEVSDTGIGVTADFLPRIFDLFAQSERSLDRSQGGLGIGLSICKRLIEMHGGEIACRSAGPGQGSTFTITLPLLQDEKPSAPAPSQPAAAARRVLIVDDNRDAADSLALCLELEGFQTLAVYSAESALAQATTYAPDIVLLDIGLPMMSGYEVARRLRANSRHLRLIALSGYGQDSDKQSAFDAGFDAHLTKPVELATIKQALSPSH